MKVSELPTELNEACLERGLAFDEDVTPQEAVEEWAGWHIGDPEWAAAIIRLFSAAKEAEKSTST